MIRAYGIIAGGVRFSLNGTTYQNNSLVTLEDIGKGDDTALLCITNRNACCQGNWFFPNETRVPSSGEMWDFYRTRKQMMVILHRTRGEENGIYCCEIHDARNVIQKIYIGVYTASTGE